MTLDSQSSTPDASAGYVPGSDGKPCKPCTAFRNWRPKPSDRSSANTSSPAAKASSNLAMTAAALASAPSSSPVQPPEDCPADVEQLGRATWTFLHSTAAYYPDKPTPVQRAHMLNLLHSIAPLYACSWCANDFGDAIKQHPPEVGSRSRLVRWLCERHNEVNKKLGKYPFDCSKADERWKDGPPNGRCD